MSDRSHHRNEHEFAEHLMQLRVPEGFHRSDAAAVCGLISTHALARIDAMKTGKETKPTGGTMLKAEG